MDFQLKKFFTLSPDLLYIAGFDGYFKHLNPAWEKILGWSIAELKAKPYFEFVHPADQPATLAEIEKLSAGAETFAFENRYQCKDGSYKWIRWRGALAFEETLIYATGRDITERKQIELALRESEERFRLMFENGPMGMALVGADFHLTRVNRAFCDMLGYTEQELTQLTFTDITHPDDIEIDVGLAEQLFQGEIPSYHIEKRYLTKQGRVIWGNLTGSIIRDSQNRPIYALGIVEDITERKRAEQALRQAETKYRTLVEQLPAIAYIVEYGQPTQTTYISPQVETLLGYSPAEWLADQELWRKLLHPDDRERVLAAVEHADATGEPLNIEYRLFTRAGDIVWVQNRWAILVGEHAVHGLMFDITGRKKIEQALQVERERLADAVNERTAALAELEIISQELERSNQELEQFAYIASHDLKEPLRMVTNYLQLLTNYYANQLDERAKEFIAFAGDGATRMRLLIDGLLAYSRVGTQGRPFAPTDCAQALQNALTNLQIAIEESRATITVSPLPNVMADEVQLTQLFQNLVGNAIKFRGQALPQIDIGATQHNSEWRFWVRDNGIGLDPEFAERIFIIFQRLHTREEYAGAGLGLAICKRIVERHGGRIWVESQPGQGATFYFTIPAE